MRIGENLKEVGAGIKSHICERLLEETGGQF